MLANVKANNATQADVSELDSIVSGLNSEFASYPADMQQQVAPSKEGLVAFIQKIRADLVAKLQKPAVKAAAAAADSGDSDSKADLQVAAVIIDEEHRSSSTQSTHQQLCLLCSSRSLLAS